MARRVRAAPPKSGLYYAREARRMSRSELVRLSGISKQQLSRLENGQIRLRLDHLKPFAPHLGYSAEQMLLWGRYPGMAGHDVETAAAPGPPPRVAEIDTHADLAPRKGARHGDPLKSQKWVFPESFVREQLHASPDHLLVLEATGDGMVPTIGAGERVIIDTAHQRPSPDGLYAVRDTFGSVIIRRLHALHASRPMRVKLISDNAKHPSEEMLLDDLEIVGKVVCCLKLY